MNSIRVTSHLKKVVDVRRGELLACAKYIPADFNFVRTSYENL